MRLSRRLAYAGVASRRASERLIAEGRVAVGGQVRCDPATDVGQDEPITVDGELVGQAEERVVYALNKPVRVLSTSDDPFGRRTVVSMVNDPRRLYPIGRLDFDSEGLILLSNDGELAYALTHPRFEVEKVYEVRLSSGPLSRQALAALRAGVRLTDGMSAPAKVREIDRLTLEMRLREGRNRQVRRMLEAVGYEVRGLRRVAIGPLKLGSLRVGASRRLSRQEVAALRDAALQGDGAGRRHAL